MAILEIILSAIISVVSVAVSIVVGGIAAVCLLGITAVLGWLPILICATDPHLDITLRADASFFEWTAAYSLGVYFALSVGVFVLAFTLEDADGVPPGVKLLGLARASASREELAAAMALGKSSWEEFFDLTRQAPGGLFKHYKTVLETQRLRRQKIIVEAETERRRAARELAEAATELETEKARVRGTRQPVVRTPGPAVIKSSTRGPDTSKPAGSRRIRRSTRGRGQRE